MKPRHSRALATVVVVLLGIAEAAGLAAAPAGTPAPGAAAAAWPKLTSVELHIFNRVFVKFHDKVEAKPGVEFRIGDTDYTAKIVGWLPDFTMNLKTREITTRGNEPKNPAFHIIVWKNRVPQDTVWAFLNPEPHFARKSLVAFVATRVRFENHAEILSEDSLAIRIRQREGQPH